MNKAILIGRITTNLQIEETNNGKEFLQFNLAVQDNFNKDKADFIRIKIWGQQANFLKNYSTKGAKIAIEGRISVNQYEKEGEKKTWTEVVADRVELLNTKAETERLSNSENNNETYKIKEKVKTQEKEDVDDKFEWELEL